MKKLLGLLAVAPMALTACTTTVKTSLDGTETASELINYSGTLSSDWSDGLFNEDNVGVYESESYKYSHGLEIKEGDTIALSVKGVDLTAKNFVENVSVAFNESTYCSNGDFHAPSASAGFTAEGDKLVSNAFNQSIAAADTNFTDGQEWFDHLSTENQNYFMNCNGLADEAAAVASFTGGYVMRQIPKGEITITFENGIAFYELTGDDYAMNYNPIMSKGTNAQMLTPSLLINADAVADTFKTKWQEQGIIDTKIDNPNYDPNDVWSPEYLYTFKDKIIVGEYSA